ncbi:DUF262 domain-containing protein [Pseudomonas aeruginosa]
MSTQKSPATLFRHPRRQSYHQAYQTTLHGMISHIKIGNDRMDAEGWTGRRVMGYRLPAWQRDFEWTVEQCQRFISSIWLGIGIGSFMVNDCPDDPSLDMLLLDAQQRLTAIEDYLNGKFPIQGEDGEFYFWGDLTLEEQCHFIRIPFPWYESAYKTETECREAYDRHNFGGTPHRESQRASKA